MALLAVPWTIKPVFGLLVGLRAAVWLATSQLFASGQWHRGGSELASAGIHPACARKSLATVRASATDYHGHRIGRCDSSRCAHGQKGQPFGLTGRFQSIQWTAANTALLLTGVLGGYIAEERLQSLAFALCGALWLFAFAVAWRYADDRKDAHLDAASFSETGAALLGVFRDPLFLGICALLTLWSFNRSGDRCSICT